MNVFGKDLSPDELRRRIGRLGQVAGVEPFVFDDGPARGVRALRFRAGGLSFDLNTTSRLNGPNLPMDSSRGKAAGGMGCPRLIGRADGIGRIPLDGGAKRAPGNGNRSISVPCKICLEKE